MDNNTNMNNGDFPNINNVKIEDTPAESFENLYGNKQNTEQTPASPAMTPTPTMNPTPAPASPTMTPNPTMNPAPTPANQPSETVITPVKMQSIEEQLSKTSQYNPEDLKQEKIEVPTDNQYEKNKSGITYLIVLCIIFGLVILALPFIIKFFS
jgi:hypothetical protein